MLCTPIQTTLPFNRARWASRYMMTLPHPPTLSVGRALMTIQLPPTTLAASWPPLPTLSADRAYIPGRPHQCRPYQPVQQPQRMRGAPVLLLLLLLLLGTSTVLRRTMVPSPSTIPFVQPAAIGLRTVIGLMTGMATITARTATTSSATSVALSRAVPTRRCARSARILCATAAHAFSTMTGTRPISPL